MIIRELQRTNLDVNLAVNNLLSRDDEDGDDGDDTASESYLPGGVWVAIKQKTSIFDVMMFSISSSYYYIRSPLLYYMNLNFCLHYINHNYVRKNVFFFNLASFWAFVLCRGPDVSVGCRHSLSASQRDY